MPADSISVDGSKIQVTMGGSRHVFEGEEREIPSNYAEGAFKIEASALPGARLHPSPATLPQPPFTHAPFTHAPC